MASTSLDTLEMRRALLDEMRQEFLQQLSLLSVEQRMQKPAPNRWSLLQVAQHLMLGEKAVLQGKSRPDSRPPRARTLKHRLLHAIVLTVLRCGIRVRVPAQSMVPDGNRTLEEIRAEWDQIHDALREHIQSLTEETVDAPIFFHPVSGPMNLNTALDLGRKHFEAHMRKITIPVDPERFQDNAG